MAGGGKWSPREQQSTSSDSDTNSLQDLPSELWPRPLSWRGRLGATLPTSSELQKAWRRARRVVASESGSRPSGGWARSLSATCWPCHFQKPPELAGRTFRRRGRSGALTLARGGLVIGNLLLALSHRRPPARADFSVRSQLGARHSAGRLCKVRTRKWPPTRTLVESAAPARRNGRPASESSPRRLRPRRRP